MAFDINNLGVPKKVLSALSSSIRVDILKLLSRQSPLTFTQIMQTMNLDPTSDAGRFGYHLRELKNSNLIKGDESGYSLTELGEKVIEFVWTLIDYSRTEIVKEIPVRTSEYAIEHFDRSKISESLIREAKVPADLAEEIAKEAEEQLMNAKVNYLTAPLIREVVNGILVLKGHEQYRHNLTRLGLPPFEIGRLIKDPKIRPLNFNPETVQKLISDAVLEQYLLLNILSRNVADAHLSGDISILNANYFIIRPSSIQHDLRPFLSKGFIAPKDSLASSLNPPKSFHQALMLSAKILEFSQIHYSGMQSIDFFNIFLAPYIKNLSKAEIKEDLLLFFQELGSTYIGPGGNIPYSTINLEFEIPKFLETTTVAAPHNGIYGDYHNEARNLLENILELLSEGAPDGKPFFNPHQVFKIRESTFTDSEIETLFHQLNEVVMKWGTPILANLTPEWQTENANYTGQLDRLDSSWKEDIELDTLRTGNLDCVYINLPRIAYESKQNDEKFFEILNEKVELVTSALIKKRNQIHARIFEDRLLPLLSYPINGENYFRLEHATNAISFIGLPETTEIHTNSKTSTKVGLKFALKIIQTLRDALTKNTESTGFRWALRQPFSQFWIERLIQLDNKRFHQNKKPASKKQFNYYNSGNINSDLTLDLSEKINLEANFQQLLGGGHLMVIPLSESSNSVESLAKLTTKTCKSSIGLFTYAHDLIFCDQCRTTIKGTQKRCPTCNSTQTLSYFNKIINQYRPYATLSKSEQFEIEHRHKFSI
ncbi:MAG: helix-turn-helix domain-containing protein [Candidatus Helarchaeota archaeon]|nr:helix-turn-helix domain-containing protein [Candidatus Helarchaeota archaeon]